MKKIAGAFVLLVFACCVLLYLLGSMLTKPNMVTIKPPTDFDVSKVMIASSTNQPQETNPTHHVAAWFKQGKPHKAGILLLHGVRSNRQQMLKRMRFLHQAGYSVMAIDMQAHGETTGEHITFGYLESRDLDTAFAELKRSVNGNPIGIIGVSLGGAATLLSDAKTQADAIVLESVYPTIQQAVENRLALRLGEVGRYLSPLLTIQLKPRLGIGVDDLKPIDQLPKLTQPVFIISGDADKHTTPTETNAMYAAVSAPKQLWLVQGAGHVDFSKNVPSEYERRILTFFDDSLSE